MSGGLYQAMQENIDKLVSGIFEYETCRLHFSVSRLELSINLTKEERGSFLIESSDDVKVHGRVLASGTRLKLSVETFYESRVEVFYLFDSTGMEEGDVLKGEINILSDAGEYTIPYVVTVTHSVLKTSIGNIKNLFHFTNLAQTDYDEAVRVFYSDEFKSIFTNNDRVYYNIYRGLSTNRNSKENVEEFLIAVHKKIPITYQTPEEPIILKSGEQSFRIPIQKIGWGFSDLHVTVDGDFLSCEKEHLTDDDFLGSKCELEITVLPEKLHGGNNSGCVILESPYDKRVVQFRLNEKCDLERGQKKHQVMLQKQALDVALVKLYIEFRIHNINKSTWESKSMTVIEQMLSFNQTDLNAKLYQAQILLSQGRKNEGTLILKHVEQELDQEKQPGLYGYYLYLTSFVDRREEYIKFVAEKVSRLYLANRSIDKLLWILLYLDEELVHDPAKQLIMMEHQFETGSKSPLIYLEAYHIYTENPVLLSKIEEFEMQVILFAVKTELFQEDLTKQILYVSTRVKRFQPNLHRILKALYQEYHSDEVLQAICTHLIKGEQIGADAFSFYTLAVERELRITRLYEYYMYSVPVDFKGTLPRMVQMYFAYSSTLEYHKNAFLYAYIIQNRKDNPQILYSYEGQIEQFALKQIEDGHINHDLALIYQYLIDRPGVREMMSEHLPQIVFSHHFKTTRRDAKYLIIVEDCRIGEQKLPLSNGETEFPIYGKSYEVFTEDGAGHRFYEQDTLLDDHFMNPSDFYPMIQGVNQIGICIYMAEGDRHYVSINRENHLFVRQMVESDDIREAYKRDFRRNLLQFYFDQDYGQELDEFLIGINTKNLTPADRTEVIEYLVKRDMFEEAFEIIHIYGAENVTSKMLLRLCCRMVMKGENEENEFLLSLCNMVFRAGKYEDMILSYLIMYEEGSTKALRNLWRAAVNFNLDTNSLEEKILLQMLYTRSFVGEKEDVFESYQKSGGKESICMAYISYNTFEYFIRDSLLDKRFFDMLLRISELNESLNDMCKLALLKYYSEDEKIKEQYHEKWILYIKSFLNRNLFFSFFKCYEEIVFELALYNDITLIEYKTNPHSRVVLHYILDTEEGSSPVYIKEEMRNLLNGIFSKSFILFFGESLQYYITEENRGKENLTQSLLLNQSDIAIGSRESRYDVLNDMLASLSLRDDESLFNLMEMYRKKQYATKRLFTII